MNVLIACEESQRVCIEMRRLGHNAFSCDIQPCSGGHPEWHIQGDCLPLIDGDCQFMDMTGGRHQIEGQWDMLIAFPPCTYLSNAGACRLYPKKGQLDIERYQKGLEGKAFFMKFLNADCPRIAVENPVSSRVFQMPHHTQEIQPWMFGHPVTKKTRLWLRGLPPLNATHIVQPTSPYVPSGTGRKDKSKYGVSKHGAKNRSKTFPGIARAMAEQWAGKCKE